MYVWSKWRCYVDGCVMSSFCSTTLTYLRRSFNQVMCVALWSDFLGVVAFDFMWYSVRDSVSCFKSWNALPPVYNKLRKLEQPTHHPLHPVLSNTFRGKMEGWYFFLGANEITTCCRRLGKERRHAPSSKHNELVFYTKVSPRDRKSCPRSPCSGRKMLWV